MEELKIILDKLSDLRSKMNGNNIKDNDKVVILTGVFLQLMSSRELFRKNSEVVEFLAINLQELKIAEYCKKSRPILLGKIANFLLNETDKYDLDEMLNLTYSFISNAIENKGDNLTWSDLIKTFKL
ncbi:hypothetical protein ABG79_02442 [Caloramator mitchellensis]|uniref:Uncharacterized protein n=1 Tax=Caloramator mitchellensis TaxID=908809 RepID=A0A0R3JQR3_CALMK|nr:hypothetical protein [Caloramator mitchellensis]KRQ85787.1 hypothetical protein ABG79_02442 [Caloramator mitchellensis]